MKTVETPDGRIKTITTNSAGEVRPQGFHPDQEPSLVKLLDDRGITILSNRGGVLIGLCCVALGFSNLKNDHVVTTTLIEVY